ncbi:glycoside hydrolase domain-containing protein [Neobacillus niacini]|uniref:glycoside hydrolase domain-containing protein n=1 Tax=Neobacillus niacini TaxID=86668 RepID=UPI00398354A6
MKTGKIFWVIVLSAFLVLSILILFFHHNSKPATTEPVKEPQTVTETNIEGDEPEKQPEPEPKPEPESQPQQEQPQILWGVDTASPLDQAFLQCVVDNYGKPAVFGRYLETKEGVSTGLTPEEVELLHQQGIKIIPIYNHFTNATTYETGAEEAQAAIAYAQQIGIPEGKAIFADIEPTYPVDDAFIRGWVDTFVGSPYKPGIYGVFTNDSALTAAYQAAITSNQNVPSQTIIWSSNPDPGVTPQADAPEYQPGAPENVPVSIWQYGIDGETCNIDTNLILSNVLDFLW